MLNDHFLIKEFGVEKLNHGREVLGQVKLSTAIPREVYDLSAENLGLLIEILDLLEYVIVDEWDLKNDKHSENEIFREAAILYIEIVQNLPKPGDDIIYTSLKFISFGYLAERWETVRRYLIEKEKELLSFEESDQWNTRLLQKIYKAIFYIVRKRHWKDLENSEKLELRT